MPIQLRYESWKLTSLLFLICDFSGFVILCKMVRENKSSGSLKQKKNSGQTK